MAVVHKPACSDLVNSDAETRTGILTVHGIASVAVVHKSTCMAQDTNAAAIYDGAGDAR